MTEDVKSDRLNHLSTEELKQQLLHLTKDRDTDPFSTKVQFYKNELAPLFTQLSRRNPFPNAQEQVPLVVGVWTPIWSTIPFQETLPGRIREQSYQIFQDNGYYANIARYAPGSKLSFLQKISSILLAYDLMIVQKFEIDNGQWFIQNVSIEQALRVRGIELRIDKAENWFNKIIKSKFPKDSQNLEVAKPEFKNFNKSTTKKFEKIFKATPQLEHLYIDRDFRLVKTQREAKQRPSYTIAVRRK